MFAGTILVKVVAVAKEVAVAHAFGTSDALDAFLIAFVVPSFAINVIAGAFPAAAMPAYVRMRDSKPREARQMLVTAILFGFIFLIVVSATIGLAADTILPLIASGFSEAKLDLSGRLLRLLLPAIVLGGSCLLIQVGLHAENRFSSASLAPICVPLTTLIAVVVLAPLVGVAALVVGVVLGYSLQALVLLYMVRRIGFRMWPMSLLVTPELRGLGRQYVPMVAGGLLMSGTWIVDQAMAAMLPAGSVSVLAYGNRLVAVSVGLGTMALGTAVLPHYSELIAAGEIGLVIATIRRWTRTIAVLSILALVVLIPFSEQLVRLVFEHGAFTDADTEIVGRIQALYLLQLPFHAVGILYVRLISALQANKYLMWGAALNLSLNIVLNIVFMAWIGVAGIALSTSAVYLASFVFLSLVLRLRLVGPGLGHGLAP